MKIAVIIPTFNRATLLKKLLFNFQNQKDHNIIVEYYVIIDGSTDGTTEMLEQDFPFVNKIKGDGNYWYTKSINEGVNKALLQNPDYVLCFNDDVEIPDNYLKNLLNCANSLHKHVIIGSLGLTKQIPYQILNGGASKYIRWRNKFLAYYPFLSYAQDHTLRGHKETIVLPGRGLLISTEIIKKIGVFDPKFKQYHSDGDFCLRAKLAGFKVYICYDSIVYCNTKITSGSSSFLKKKFDVFLSYFFNPVSRLHLASNARFIFRHGNKVLFPITFLIFVLASFKAYFFNKKLE